MDSRSARFRPGSQSIQRVFDALFSLNPSMKVFLATSQPASAGSFLGGTVLKEASLTIG
jgi:hypothetical protein